jgi:hypothetical protein
LAHDAVSAPQSAPAWQSLSGKITIVVADQLYIDRTDLPPATTARLIRLAAFQNPEFYRAQSMRFPTFGKPRIISCAELHRRHVGLPRGCLDEAVELIRAEGAEVELNDLRVIGNRLRAEYGFRGRCTSRSSGRLGLFFRMRMACSRRRPLSARQSWSRPLSRNADAMRSFLSIAASYSPSGWNG